MSTSIASSTARRAGTAVWAYCLMPNHVYRIVTPTDADGLRATFAEVHRRYTGVINARFRWTGHLFQGRLGAVVIDEPHLLAAARYIALNPVVAGLGELCRGLAMAEHPGAARGRG
jgi:putative transposase